MPRHPSILAHAHSTAEQTLTTFQAKLFFDNGNYYSNFLLCHMGFNHIVAPFYRRNTKIKTNAATLLQRENLQRNALHFVVSGAIPCRS